MTALILLLLAGDPSLEAVLAPIAPEVDKFATVIEVTGPAGQPAFRTLHYRNSAEAVDFWPASTIKLYVAVAALELLGEKGLPTDTTVTFARRTEGRWIVDCARTVPEMTSEVFRRSSNEDYTLLLRTVGIDRLNTRFLVPANGFDHSALMRGYVLHRPHVYVRDEPQRITLTTPDGRREILEHTWSGTSYSQERGATVISATTGNVTSTRELAECLRRVMFHEHLPAEQRYDLTADQLALLRSGRDGLTGLENRQAGLYGWEKAAAEVFPDARFYHKAGWISSDVLDLAYVDDGAHSGVRYLVCVAARTGEEDVARRMARAIADWQKAKHDAAAPAPAAVEIP